VKLNSHEPASWQFDLAAGAKEISYVESSGKLVSAGFDCFCHLAQQLNAFELDAG